MSTDKITQILHSKVIPWMMSNGAERLILAQPHMDQSMMPFRATIERRQLAGKRSIRKNKRIHANQRLHVADWPEDNLQELAVPKLICVVEGEINYLVAEHKIHCAEGHFILIPPRLAHQRSGPYFTDASSRPYVMLQAYGYSQGVSCWITSTRHGRHFHANSDNYLITNSSCASIMQLLAEEMAEPDNETKTICAQLCAALFVLLKREIAAGHFTHPGPKSMPMSMELRDGHFTDQLQIYLETNCHKPLTQDSVAEYFYMSRSKFTRLIKRHTGSTFSQLLTNIRLERAQVLLVGTDWTFNAIANYLSFKSPSYFLSLFKQHTGCTPGQFRENARKT